MEEKKKMKAALLAMVATLLPLGAMAQDRVEASVGADLVSGYVWRGQDLGNVSIQPGLSVGYKGWSLAVWGSVGIDKEDTKELDLTLGYSTGGFSLSVTDYWFKPDRVISVTEQAIRPMCLKRRWDTTSVRWPSTGTLISPVPTE